MYQQPRHLPADPVQPQHHMIPNLPYSIEGVYFNIDCPPTLSNYVPLISGYILKALQDGSHRSHLRCFLFNLCAGDFANNPTFIEMLQTTVEYLQMRLNNEGIMPQDRQRIEQVIAESSDQVVNIFCSLMFSRYPELGEYVNPQDMSNVQYWLDFAQKVQYEVSEFKQRQLQPAPMHQPQAYGVRPQYGVPAPQPQVYPNPTRQYQGNMGYTKPVDPRATNLASAYGRRSTPTSNDSMKDDQRGLFDNKSAVMSANAVRGAFGNRKSTSPTVHQSVLGSLTSMANPAPSQPMTTHPHKEVLDRTQASDDYYPITKERKREFTRDKPYAEAYDPDKEYPVLYQDPRHGKLMEKFLAKREGKYMDYYEHELNLTFANAVKRDANDVGNKDMMVPIMRDVADALNFDDAKAHVRANEEAVLENTAEGELPDVKPISVPTILSECLPAASLRESLGQAESILVENGMSEDSFVEYQWANLGTYTVSSSQYDIIRNMHDVTDLVRLGELLYAMKEGAHARWWYDIQTMLTDTVNEALRTTVPLDGWKIDAFVDDIAELMTLMTEHHGEEIAQIFNDGVHEVITTLFENMQYKTLAEGIVEFSHGVVSSVSRINLRATDLGIAFTGNGGAIPSSKFPALHKALVRIYDRNGDLLRNRYIVTQDNRVLKLYKAWLSEDTYLLSLADWE